MDSNTLVVQDLKVNYGNVQALKGISFNVPKGKIVSLIGANGAGKPQLSEQSLGTVLLVDGFRSMVTQFQINSLTNLLVRV